MNRRNTIPAVLAVLLLACLVAFYVTRDPSAAPVAPKAPPSATTVSIDSSLLKSANRLASLAETVDEQNQASQAVHLADHELDQAFETAMRQAEAYRPPPGRLRDLTANIDSLRDEVSADQQNIAQLTRQIAQPGSNAGDKLELAKAELALDQDELADAQQDLARQGGDPHSTLVRALQAHQASQQAAAQNKSAISHPTTTLVEQVQAWLAARSLSEELDAARQQAANQAKVLVEQHRQLEPQVATRSSLSSDLKSASAQPGAIANLHRLSDLRKTLTEFDQRIQDSQQLTGVYRTWSALVDTRQRAVLHLMLGSLAEILAIVLLAFLANLAIRRILGPTGHKRVQQVRVIAAVALQVAAIVAILLVSFGVPSQISTIIGLATAGLTVVLRDFIVAFFGWFTLMGKHGIRAGDWVEINGVSGEVIEVGLLKTVLLESGNWTDTGHPTGRQVAFSNGFAMEGHYFNFSTAGQWLWDELAVALPATGDPYLLAEAIRKLVEHETEPDAAEAEQDWEHATGRYAVRNFSAKPVISLRPTASGLEAVVRYITHASQRYALRSKLLEVIVNLLHKPGALEPVKS